MRRMMRVIGLGLLGAMLIAGPVNAGKPDMGLVPVDDVFVDTFLSDECGVEVNAHVTGHFIFRTFNDADGNPVREVNNYAFGVRYWSEYGEIRAKDVGADRITYLDDGSIIVLIIGNVQSFTIPGKGRIYSDVGRTQVLITFGEDGEPMFDVTPLGGQHDPDQLGAICGVLGG